jgi:hypothetical protein
MIAHLGARSSDLAAISPLAGLTWTNPGSPIIVPRCPTALLVAGLLIHTTVAAATGKPPSSSSSSEANATGIRKADLDPQTHGTRASTTSDGKDGECRLLVAGHRFLTFRSCLLCECPSGKVRSVFLRLSLSNRHWFHVFETAVSAATCERR